MKSAIMKGRGFKRRGKPSGSGEEMLREINNLFAQVRADISDMSRTIRADISDMSRTISDISKSQARVISDISESQSRMAAKMNSHADSLRREIRSLRQIPELVSRVFAPSYPVTVVFLPPAADFRVATGGGFGERLQDRKVRSIFSE